MSSKDARTFVQRGLDRRKADRRAAELEIRLEQYERDMITACNNRHMEPRPEPVKKGATCCDKLANLEAQEARRAARREAKAKEMLLEKKATDAVKCYGAVCLGLLLLSAWSHLPLWAVLTVTMFGMSLPLAYVIRLYSVKEAVR